jgi:AGZA family xanthine/uracil permease-like MFS transporter
VEFVGPQVGEELTEQGGLAVLYSVIGILIYVAMRFEWRFSLGAIAATIHDAIITLGVFSVFQLDFDLNVLAAILTVIGGVNVTESARVGGDDFDTRQILLTEAVATLVGGLCGGVAQSTPYIGQPAYKAMGARLGYTAMTGIFVGLGGMLGYISFFVKLIPAGVLAPILVFVALDIVVQAFLATARQHAPAVALAHIPTLARLLAIKYNDFIFLPEDWTKRLAPTPEGLSEVQVVVALGNGFILTAMLWGAFLAELIDRRLLRSAGYLMVLGALTVPGIIHSALPAGNMYNPLHLAPDAALVPKLFGLGYFALAGLFVLLSFTPESKEAPDPSASHGGHFG